MRGKNDKSKRVRLIARNARNSERIATFICEVCDVMCGDVFAGDDALFTGMQMQNDRSHIKCKINNFCGLVIRCMLYKYAYIDYRCHFIVFSP